MTKFDFFHLVKMLLRAFDSFDPSVGHVFIPLFEKQLLASSLVPLLNFLVQLFQKLLLDSLGRLLLLELFLVLNLFLNDFIELYLIFHLFELSKTNQSSITVADLDFAFRAC
jgi:hypothetical protein